MPAAKRCGALKSTRRGWSTGMAIVEATSPSANAAAHAQCRADTRALRWWGGGWANGCVVGLSYVCAQIGAPRLVRELGCTKLPAGPMIAPTPRVMTASPLAARREPVALPRRTFEPGPIAIGAPSSMHESKVVAELVRCERG